MQGVKLKSSSLLWQHTGLVHFSFCLQAKKNILQCCHGDAIVDNSQIGLTVELREQACDRHMNEYVLLQEDETSR